MFFVFLILFILVFLESFLLYRKKINKMSIVLALINFVTMIVSLFILKNKFSLNYSTIVYMDYLLSSNTFLFILWILLYSFYSFYLINVLHKAIKRKIQIKALYYLIKILLYFTLIVFIRIIFGDAFVYLTFITLLLLIIYLVFKIVKRKKNSKVNYLYGLLIVVLLFFFFNIYFQVDGAIRYAIFLKGYPGYALSINYEEMTYYKNDKNIKYELFIRIPLADGDYNVVEVSNNLIKRVKFLG